MPLIPQTVTVTETKEVFVSKDKDGRELKVGDKVVVVMTVSGIYEEQGLRPGDPPKDVVSCYRELPSGHRVHMGNYHADIMQKVE